MSNQQSLLQNFYLFKDWNHADLHAFSEKVRTTIYSPGDEIFSEGDTASSIYIVKFGTVRIEQKGKVGQSVAVATVGTGSHFGELPFLDDERRSATVVALEKTEMIVVEFSELSAFLQHHKDAAIHFYKALATFLAGRLRVTTNDLSFAREKNLRHF